MADTLAFDCATMAALVDFESMQQQLQQPSSLSPVSVASDVSSFSGSDASSVPPAAELPQLDLSSLPLPTLEGFGNGDVPSLTPFMTPNTAAAVMAVSGFDDFRMPAQQQQQHYQHQQQQQAAAAAMAAAAAAVAEDDEEPALGAGTGAAPFRTKTVRRAKTATVEAFMMSLTEREKEMLAAEGAHIPDHGFALTKAEQKDLRQALRKVRNKISAQESRVRKREYVGDLEARVEQVTVINMGLQQRVTTLETENAGLLQQIAELQKRLAAKTSGATGTCLMLLGLCFALCVAPQTLAGGPNATSPAVAAPASFQARTLKSTPGPGPLDFKPPAFALFWPHHNQDQHERASLALLEDDLTTFAAMDLAASETAETAETVETPAAASVLPSAFASRSAPDNNDVNKQRR